MVVRPINPSCSISNKRKGKFDGARVWMVCHRTRAHHPEERKDSVQSHCIDFRPLDNRLTETVKPVRGFDWTDEQKRGSTAAARRLDRQLLLKPMPALSSSWIIPLHCLLAENRLDNGGSAAQLQSRMMEQATNAGKGGSRWTGTMNESALSSPAPDRRTMRDGTRPGSRVTRLTKAASGGVSLRSRLQYNGRA